MSLQAKMKRNHKAGDTRDRETLNAVIAGHAAMAGAINAERSATKEVSTFGLSAATSLCIFSIAQCVVVGASEGRPTNS